MKADDKGSLQLLLLLAIIVASGVLYVCSLPLAVPLPVAVVGVISCVALIVWKFNSSRKLPVDVVVSQHFSLVTAALLAAGLSYIASEAAAMTLAYGEYDAVGVWNLHARYLASPEHWRNIFLNRDYAHPDYPLLVPSLVALGWRFTGCENLAVPFVVSMVPVLLTPALLYTELRKQSLLLAILSLYFFGTSWAFMHTATSQQADAWLGLVFVSLLIANRMVVRAHFARGYVLTGFLAAACLWIKNEGLLLAAMFFVFQLGFLVKHLRRLLAFSAGAMSLLLPYLYFKLVHSPPGDMASPMSEIVRRIASPERYALILQKLWFFARRDLWPVLLFAALAMALCRVRRRWPNKDFFLLLACLGCYMAVYVITPYNLEWHLDTSFDRLLQQLMPAFLWTVGLTHTRRSHAVL